MQNSDAKIGILLMNLGTPDAPTPSAVRKYLKEFLSDRRVVDVNPLIWWPVLNGIILNVRPKKVAKVYQQVWMDDGSPLLVLAQRLREKLQSKVDESHIVVELAMTYGNPSVEVAAKRFRREKVSQILVVPMYPQFSRSTTAAAFDRLMASLKQCPDWPEMQLVRSYAVHENYVSALVDSVKQQWAKQGGQRHLVFSYHGVPKRYVDQGDPYERECRATTEAVVKSLGLGEGDYTHVYQSRFGREEWLRPYADETLAKLSEKGVKSINVVSPAFSIDCIETLEEIDDELRHVFLDGGGEEFDYIPALNDSESQVHLYLNLIDQYTRQWRANET